MMLGWGSSGEISIDILRNASEVANLSLAASHGDVYESAGVGYPLLGAALGGLLLLLGLDLNIDRLASVINTESATAGCKRPKYSSSMAYASSWI